jgi:hypothetical protein
MGMQKENNLDHSSAGLMVIQKASQMALLTERQSEHSLTVIQMVMKKVSMSEMWKVRRLDVVSARLKEMRLVHELDEMMA